MYWGCFSLMIYYCITDVEKGKWDMKTPVSYIVSLSGGETNWSIELVLFQHGFHSCPGAIHHFLNLSYDEYCSFKNSLHSAYTFIILPIPIMNPPVFFLGSIWALRHWVFSIMLSPHVVIIHSSWITCPALSFILFIAWCVGMSHPIFDICCWRSFYHLRLFSMPPRNVDCKFFKWGCLFKHGLCAKLPVPYLEGVAFCFFRLRLSVLAFLETLGLRLLDAYHTILWTFW